MPKVKDVDSSGSLCIDSIQFNLVREGCKSIQFMNIESGVQMYCVKSKLQNQWTKKIFYIETTAGEPNPPPGFAPMCIDRNIAIYGYQEENESL